MKNKIFFVVAASVALPVTTAHAQPFANYGHTQSQMPAHAQHQFYQQPHQGRHHQQQRGFHGGGHQQQMHGQQGGFNSGNKSAYEQMMNNLSNAGRQAYEQHNHQVNQEQYYGGGGHQQGHGQHNNYGHQHAGQDMPPSYDMNQNPHSQQPYHMNPQQMQNQPYHAQPQGHASQQHPAYSQQNQQAQRSMDAEMMHGHNQRSGGMAGQQNVFQPQGSVPTGQQQQHNQQQGNPSYQPVRNQPQQNTGHSGWR